MKTRKTPKNLCVSAALREPKEPAVKPALVPKLRFPEFRDAGEWVRRRLGDIADVSASGDLDSATFCPERSDEHCFPIYSNAVEKEGIYGFSSMARCKANSVTITARGTLGRAFLRTTDFVGIGRLIVVTNFEGDANSSFLKECWEHLAVIPQEVTSIPQLTAVAAHATALPFPTIPEQQKIAECLSSVDELIAAQARKLDALKTHKKGLMQQLFPREGETQPRLRFPEFQTAGEWVVKTLDAVAPLQRGFDLPSDEIRPGSVPIVYSNGPKGFHERGMAKGPGLVTGRSGTIGKLHFIKSGDYWPHNTSLWVTSFKGHAPKFVFYLYESIGFIRFASGSGVPTLNRNDAHSFETSVPPSLIEQQRIADCLTSLDELIAAQTQKLDTLKVHKKGLMQQLFPSSEETA